MEHYDDDALEEKIASIYEFFARQSRSNLSGVNRDA